MRFYFLVAACLLLTGQAQAQYYGTPSYHASTAEEGMANGMANVIQAAGQAHLLNAQAATEAEVARQAYLQNRLLATQNYFQMRELNKEARQKNQSKPLSMEQYVRLAKLESPERLSVSELDSFDGKIYWPPQLMGDEYAEQRAKLSTLFQRRARGDLQIYPEIKAQADVLLSDLKRNIEKMSPQDYIRAKNFVAGLGYEANFAVR